MRFFSLIFRSVWEEIDVYDVPVFHDAQILTHCCPFIKETRPTPFLNCLSAGFLLTDNSSYFRYGSTKLSIYYPVTQWKFSLFCVYQYHSSGFFWHLSDKRNRFQTMIVSDMNDQQRKNENIFINGNKKIVVIGFSWLFINNEHSRFLSLQSRAQMVWVEMA